MNDTLRRVRRTPGGRMHPIISAPLRTCRHVVGYDDKGRDRYCCGPVAEGSAYWICDRHRVHHLSRGQSTQAGSLGRAPAGFKMPALAKP